MRWRFGSGEDLDEVLFIRSQKDACPLELIAAACVFDILDDKLTGTHERDVPDRSLENALWFLVQITNGRRQLTKVALGKCDVTCGPLGLEDINREHATSRIPRSSL